MRAIELIKSVVLGILILTISVTSVANAQSAAKPSAGVLVPILDLLLSDEDVGACRGIEDEVEEAIYVDINTGLDGNDGSMEFPVSSINQGITLARMSATINAVFVQQGRYEEAVILHTGIQLYGGFDETWERCEFVFTTINTIRSKVTALEIVNDKHALTVVERFRIFSGADTAAGASAYGMRIANTDAPIILRSNSIDATSAQAGSDGFSYVTGDAGSLRQRFAAAGGDGSKGIDGRGGIGAFESAFGRTGGDGGVSACADGGSGGNSGLNAIGGKDGVSGRITLVGQMAGLGGRGGAAAGSCFSSGVDGGNGLDGKKGRDGDHARYTDTVQQVLGSYSSEGFWSPSYGPDGAKAQDGTGGGGGGGGGGGRRVLGVCKLDVGGSGGGGGGGGCGGRGGRGGQGGGSSIAVFIYQASNVLLEDNGFFPDMGGEGGRGGIQEGGGQGGVGKAGGKDADQAGGGGRGGDGGNGGRGGGGAGGPGGHSACVWAKSSQVEIRDNGCQQNRQAASGGQAQNLFLSVSDVGADNGPDGRVEDYYFED